MQAGYRNDSQRSYCNVIDSCLEKWQDVTKADQAMLIAAETLLLSL